MKLLTRLILLITLLASACSAANAETPTTTPAPVRTLTALPSPTVLPSPTSLPPATVTQSTVPSPTAIILPTSAEDLPATAAPTEPLPEATATALAAQSPTPEPTSESFLDQYLPRREKVAETEHFIFYQQDDYEPIDMKWWIEQSEVVYDYVSQRMQNAHVKKKISLGFVPPETRACPVRGLASNDNGLTVLVYADEKSERPYLLSVLAHEIGHAISYDFPEGLPGATSLAEGLATWAAGKYWAEWKQVADLDALVAAYIQKGEYESISSNYDLHGIYPWQENIGTSQECIARRDRIYSEWGAFTGYLIDTYGWEKIHRLYKTRTEERDGKRIEYPPDYEGVYGKALNQLEADWVEKIGK